MVKTNTKKGISTKISENSVKILITTNDHLISGKLFLPIPSSVENPTNEILLFYALNCGNKFIQLHDCIIQSKDSIEYSPEQIKCYNINLDIVHSCHIIDEN
jgi:hypothetical protein